MADRNEKSEKATSGKKGGELPPPERAEPVKGPIKPGAGAKVAGTKGGVIGTHTERARSDRSASRHGPEPEEGVEAEKDVSAGRKSGAGDARGTQGKGKSSAAASKPPANPAGKRPTREARPAGGAAAKSRSQQAGGRSDARGTAAGTRAVGSEPAPNGPPPEAVAESAAVGDSGDSAPPTGGGSSGSSSVVGSGSVTVSDASPESFSLLDDHDLHLFNEGSHFRLYEKLGAHPIEAGGQRGVYFAVWAPNADRVSVIGDFNGWNNEASPLRVRGASGIWEGFIAGPESGSRYKYHIRSRHNGYTVDKADPFGFMHETPPATGSVVRELWYEWGDSRWMEERRQHTALDRPQSIYEVHLGSWLRTPENDMIGYRELAPRLADYCKQTGFNFVEFLPVMEHPFYGSWGYQTTGYFAPTSRFGGPQDFMFLIDHLHQNGIGVILDWVPSHFPTDEHGLSYFDGTHLFEHEDPRQGYHPDWKSSIFNYGRAEVQSFLISSAMFWLDVFHADGLRVDAVASMLYLDYSRESGEWIPNEHGGRENLEAISFLRRLNSEVYRVCPNTQTMAEESTAWPMVSRPVYVGGLGFGMKWDMGWMHDTLQYMQRDPVHRHWHHNELTFRPIYAFSENFVLPLSHDEVVHGKGSLIGKMPGDPWRKFANLRLMYAYMWTQPGKKLLFMGGDIAQGREWNHDIGLDWHLLDDQRHAGVQRLLGHLNRVYRSEPAMYELDFDPAGFEWISGNDSANSVLVYLRRGRTTGDVMVCAFNFTPIPQVNYRVGVPFGGTWQEVVNTDAEEYGGSGHGNMGAVEAAPIQSHGRPYAVNLTIPPLGAVILKGSPENA